MTHPATVATATSMDSGRSYEVIGELGRGGFGAVFKARLVGDAGFTKLVAIKMLHDEGSARKEFGDRLRDEARLLARLRHRAIVAVDDLVRIEGRWAVVMEYVEGADLLSLIRLGPIPARSSIEIAIEVASALHVVHSATDAITGKPLHIVHRDLKPSNVRVTPHGEVKLLDFGIARAAFEGREAVTGSLRFESAGYVAPERLFGMDSAAADIFSLGVVLYEMLAGERLGPLPERQIPYERARDQALEALIQRAPEQNLAGVVAIIARALAFEDRDRPSADQLADQLRGLLNEAPGDWLARWAPAMVREAAGEEDLPSVGAEPLSVASLAAEVDGGPGPTVGQPPPISRHASEVNAPALTPKPPPPALQAIPPEARLALGVAAGLLLVGLVAAVAVIWMQLHEDPGAAEASAQGPASAAEAGEDEGADPPPVEVPSVAVASLAPAAPAEGAPVEVAPVEVAPVEAAPRAAPATKAAAPVEVTPAETIPAATAPVEATATEAPSPAPSSGEGAATPSRAGGKRGGRASKPAAPVAEVADPADWAPTMGTLVVEGRYNKAEWIDLSGVAHPPGAAAPGRYRLRVRFDEQLSWVETGVTATLVAGETVRVTCSYESEACRMSR